MLEGADVVWGGCRVAAHNGEGTHQGAVLGSQSGVTGVHHPACTVNLMGGREEGSVMCRGSKTGWPLVCITPLLV